ncbi:MAG: DUF2332 domain-containing protein [Proteobacteria bacterium]|nr:MAG: DUF2332 domain-containing protein [Pseudomonadota bacterium]
MSAPAPTRERLVQDFRTQAAGCANMGSPIWAELLQRAADDLERGGIWADVVADYRGEPILDALPLRILGAAHGMALAGRAPSLAAFLPSTGGRFDAEGAWAALQDLLRAHADEMRRAATSRRVQTNEVRRSAALLPGFLRIAQRTGLPLRIREIGASGGLNLLFDRYHYALGPHRWGDPASPLHLATEWSGGAPDLDAKLLIESRRGCDVAPIDLGDPAERIKLQSFVWPEQLDRLERLRAALAVVAADPPPIDAAPAGEWVEREIEPAPGVATVLFHSVVWWYVPEAERDRVTRWMESAGARASRAAPLAWLRMEGANIDGAELRLRLWPGNEEIPLAAVHWHGATVRWLA